MVSQEQKLQKKTVKKNHFGLDFFIFTLLFSLSGF